MSRLRVVPIVEGHGEYSAVRTLLERIWYELVKGEYLDVLRPIREKRDRLVSNKNDALTKAVQLAAGKLAAVSTPGTRDLILVLVDSEGDPPCLLGPDLLKTAQAARPDMTISCVVAHVAYETWFVAAAESLEEYLDLQSCPAEPETVPAGKGWIKKRFKGVKYSETVDQPKLTAKMDLQIARDRSPSFDKLCRELEKQLPQKNA